MISHWHAALQAETPVRILHIVDAVADALAGPDMRGGCIGVLATSGTVKAGIYQKRHALRVIRSRSQKPLLRGDLERCQGGTRLDRMVPIPAVRGLTPEAGLTQAKVPSCRFAQ